MDRPSGDQRGVESLCSPLVKARGSAAPSTGATQMLLRYSLVSSSIVVTVNATVEPSGDNRGSPTAVNRPMSAGCIPLFNELLGRAVPRAQHSLGGGETGDRHPERRAGHVVEPGVVEEGDRLRVAAVLTAHAELEVGVGLAAPLGALVHELAHAARIDGLERVALQQSLLDVGRHHAALDVVAAEAERHLGQVVGAEGEEVGLLGDL